MRAQSIHNAWLNGVALSSIDASIIVRPAIEPEQKSNITYISNVGRSGRFIADDRRESKVVQVRFSIKGHSNLNERMRIIDAVNGWAATGGKLQISSRTDQQIWVTCIKYVTPADIISLAGVYVLEFEANGIPFWQDINERYIRINRDNFDSQDAWFNYPINGTTETVINYEAKALNDTALMMVQVVVISANGRTSSITLDNINVPANQSVILGHDSNDILSITTNGISLLDKRTASSDDDLFVWPGTAKVTVYANTGISLHCSHGGRWL